MPLTAISGVLTTANTVEDSPANKRKNKKTRKKTNKKKKRMRLTANTVPAGVPTTANTVEDSPANKKKNKKKKRKRLTAKNTVPAGVPTTANTVEDSPAKKKRMRLAANTVPAGVPTSANTVEDSPANKKKNKKKKRMRLIANTVPTGVPTTANTVEDSPANKKKNKKKKRMRLTNTVPAGVPTTTNTVEDSPANKKKKKRMRLTTNTVPADRKKKRTANTVPADIEEWEDRKKGLPAINPAAQTQAEEERKKSLAINVITGEELEAHKAEWCAQLDPDQVPPWKSKYGAGMEDETQWPPIWKERFEECPEYEALRDYLIFDPANYPTYKISETLAEQIRESRGYDVTESRNGFIVYSPEMVRESNHFLRVICKYVTDQINERAKKHGEFYVYVEVKKVAMALFDCFYTFTVKEATSHELKTVQAYVFCQTFAYKVLVYLMEWRFKLE